jgi:hypothetical protein
MRVLFNLLILMSVLVLPWWVAVMLFVPLLLIADAYEVLVWGFVLDALYSSAVPLYFNVPVLFTAAAFLLFVVVMVLKRRLFFY